MPTIAVDKYKLFEALGKQYVLFWEKRNPKFCPSFDPSPSPTIQTSDMSG